MATAKGAVLTLLAAAYPNRDRVGLVAFRDEEARVLLHPTTSVTLARERLRRLAVGGATPLARGLDCAWKVARAVRVREPGSTPLLVVLSDGEANVPLEPGRSVAREVLAIGRAIRRDGLRSILIDTKYGPPHLRPMVALSRAMGARYHHLSRLRAASVVQAVRDESEQAGAIRVVTLPRV